MRTPHGSGSNGKSVVFNTALQVIGDYGAITRPELIMSRSSSSEMRLARLVLQGKRLVVIPETEATDRLAESQVKQLTGSEPVEARAHHGYYFSFPASTQALFPFRI